MVAMIYSYTMKSIVSILFLVFLFCTSAYAAKSKYCAMTGLHTVENIRYFAKSKPSVILSTHRPAAFAVLPNKCVSDTYNVSYKEVSSSLFKKLIEEFEKSYASLGGTKENEGYKENNETKIVEQKKQKKEKVVNNNKIIAAGSGSGFFVTNKGHIITNYHVIEGCNSTKVSFKGDEFEAKIISVDKVNDIAILKTNIRPNNIFSVSNDDVMLLEDVIVAGYPLGKRVSSAIKTHKGVVTSLAGAGDNFSEFQTDATINQGNSGGPVINQKGNVVGIAVALLDVSVGQNIFFAIKSSTLKQFANSNSLKFLQPNTRDLSNRDLGKLITEATVYLECWMTLAKIKKMIAQEENRKAFFTEFQ